jgi:hypothetical protein
MQFSNMAHLSILVDIEVRRLRASTSDRRTGDSSQDTSAELIDFYTESV